jgi:BirA family biotin operon repressor/biotin-[acetyl-CoA-carboxylase] ligase
MPVEALLRKLADAGFHSGEALACDLGVTRAAVWKRMQQIRDWGLEVEAVPRRGYRLALRLDLIDVVALGARLEASLGSRLGRLEVFTELESTNRHLLEGAPPDPGRLDVCVAEYQSAGRGRRGRVWRAPLGACLCLSVGAGFAETPPDLAALTLAVGALVRGVLVDLTGARVMLKWPNDLVVGDAKLGGILVELAAEAHGGCHVVIGIGINVELSAALCRELCAWPAGAVDLTSVVEKRLPSRTELTGALVERLATLVDGYPRTGFAPYRGQWRSADYLRDRAVSIQATTYAERGTARGIADDGALLLELEPDGELKRVISGDVSVRNAQ